MTPHSKGLKAAKSPIKLAQLNAPFGILNLRIENKRPRQIGEAVSCVLPDIRLPWSGSIEFARN
jgi:hypothetical protein